MPWFRSLCSPGAFPGIVLSPGTAVQLFLKSPAVPEAFFFLASIHFTWCADVALWKEALCWSLYGKGSDSQCKLWHLDQVLKNQIHFFFLKLSCCAGKRDTLLLMIVGYTHWSNGTEKLWNSFLYDQILLKIRKSNENQGVQAYSQISPFQLCLPPVVFRSWTSEQQSTSSSLPLPLWFCYLQQSGLWVSRSGGSLHCHEVNHEPPPMWEEPSGSRGGHLADEVTHVSSAQGHLITELMMPDRENQAQVSRSACPIGFAEGCET